MCKRNAQSQEKQLVVHSGGSKTLSRKRFEMEHEIGQPISRGKVFVATHTKVDGSYANNATKFVCDKIIQVESEGSCPQTIAKNDSLGQVFGKDPSGRVRGLGLGPCPSQVFGIQRQRHDEGGSSSSTSDSIDRMQLKIADLEARLEREAKSRIQFQNAVSLFLQCVSASSMTPELVVILKSIATNDGDVEQSNGSSCAEHDGDV